MEDEDDLPDDLKYIAIFVHACNEFGAREAMYAYVDGLSNAQEQRWLDLCNEIQAKNHAAYIDSVMKSTSNRRLALLLVRFLAVCDAVNGVTEEERITRLLASPPDYGTPDWSRLPAGFDYLIAPAERFGQFMSEATQCDQIDRFSDRDFDVLNELAKRMEADNAATVLGEWFKIRGDELYTHREMQMIESLISMFTLCGISYGTDESLFKTQAELESLTAGKMLGELCSACILNDNNAVDFLAAAADINILDHNDQSPLSYAVGNHHIECVRTLLRHGANPNLVQNGGNTPMHICARSGASEELFQLLVEAGGNSTIRNENGDSAFDIMT